MCSKSMVVYFQYDQYLPGSHSCGLSTINDPVAGGGGSLPVEVVVGPDGAGLEAEQALIASAPASPMALFARLMAGGPSIVSPFDPARGILNIALPRKEERIGLASAGA
jgi:hypothetical protein